MKKKEHFRSQAQTKSPVMPVASTSYSYGSGPNWASMTDDTELCATHINRAEAVRHADRGEVLNKQTPQEREKGSFREGVVGGRGTGLLVVSYTSLVRFWTQHQQCSFELL